MEHKGGCHCGNLSLKLRLSTVPGDVRLRACQCSFCRAHNTRTTSDPQGAAEIWAKDWSLVQLYRFGTATADFLICRRCGVYIGAVTETEDGTRSVINTNCLQDRGAFSAAPVPVNHDGEATQDRRERRVGSWTPTIIHR